MGLSVDDLWKEYPTRSGTLPVLAGITLTLNAGEALAIMGPSGSGKSTLLNIIGTLDAPTRGTVTLDDVNPFALPERGLAAFRNQRVGFVFQDHHLLPQCTVLENVLVPALVAGERERAVARSDARRLLDRVGLGARLDHRPAELSGGERQRAAIARALIRKPMLLLADEPTGNLDRKTAQGVGEILTELHRQERTVLVVVTHSPEFAALFSRRAEMSEGKLEFRD
jgi:lipoprotein-releasing system ATP-binding protein